MNIIKTLLIIGLTGYLLMAGACSSRKEGKSQLHRSETCPQSVIDLEGNQYATVTIGKRCWMAENIRSLQYRNGTRIGEVFVYDNDESNVADYGRLYTWKAANAAPICPEGFHIPTEADWQELELGLGMSPEVAEETGWRHSADESRKLKRFDNAVFWTEESQKAINESGFSALPGGVRSDGGKYFGLGSYADFWSSSEVDETTAFNRSLVWMVWHPGSDEIYRNMTDKNWGFSVRCIQD